MSKEAGSPPLKLGPPLTDIAGEGEEEVEANVPGSVGREGSEGQGVRKARAVKFPPLHTDRLSSLLCEMRDSFSDFPISGN